MTARGPLEGVTIIDLSMHVSGPYATMLLADMGAEVIKVEPLGGDPQRAVLPLQGSMSVMFGALNRNKKSICLDLKTTSGRELFLQLAGTADVVVNNFRPGVMEKLGLSFEAVRAANSRIVYASLSGYGSTGPRRDAPAYDAVIQAVGGGMSITGHPGGLPARSGVPIADMGGGLMLSSAILAGIVQCDRRGEAIEIETSLFDSHVSLMGYWAALYLNAGLVAGPQGSGHVQSSPYGAFRAADGFIVVAPNLDDAWRRMALAMGRDDLAADERFATRPSRLEHRTVLEGELQTTFLTRSVEEWVKVLEAAHVPCGPVNDIPHLVEDPQLAARDMRVSVDDGGEHWELIGNPIKVVPGGPMGTAPPPKLGEHGAALLGGRLGLPDGEVARYVAEGVVGPGLQSTT